MTEEESKDGESKIGSDGQPAGSIMAGARPPAGAPSQVTAGSAGALQGVLGRLEASLAGASGRGPAPVERWNPPYCGDIGMAIARDGTWSYRGSPIRRMPLVKLFASVLRRDEDGRHYLVTPVEKVDVAVEDAAFTAVELEVLGEGRNSVIVVRTNLDDVVRVGPAHPLRFAVEPGTGGLKPYVGVRGRLEALFTRALVHDLLDLAIEDEQGLAIHSGGETFRLPS